MAAVSALSDGKVHIRALPDYCCQPMFPPCQTCWSFSNALKSGPTEYGFGSAGIAKFDERTAHLLMAAADYVIIPSRFEPCGLVAQSAARYGAIPIVTAVGGLKDFVTDKVNVFREREACCHPVLSVCHSEVRCEDSVEAGNSGTILLDVCMWVPLSKIVAPMRQIITSSEFETAAVLWSLQQTASFAAVHKSSKISHSG